MKAFSQILLALKKHPQRKIPAVLATLVSVEGSSYRRAGARMLWCAEGKPERIGGISGGCLEEDLAAHCREVAQTGAPKTVVYDTTDENDLVWGTGLGCNGIVRVLVEPVSKELRRRLREVSRAWAERAPSVLATVFAYHDERAPQSARVPLGAVPQLLGTLFEKERRACLENEESRTHLFRELPGAPEIFFQFLPPPVSLVIFGAGDDARPLSRMAKELGWRVAVVDVRPAHATHTRFLDALDARTCAVVMTHHYVHDVPLMRALLTQRLAYLGLLGPKKRAEKIFAELRSGGFPVTAAMRARVRAPVGLDLGGNGPEAVALSILSEIQSVLNERDARPLRERKGAIHGGAENA